MFSTTHRLALIILLPLLLLTACSPEHGPGGELLSGRYTIEAPHDGWIAGGAGQNDGGLFIRLYKAGDDDELGYLEILPYNRYLDDEATVRSLGLESTVQADLANMLTIEVERVSDELIWLEDEARRYSEPLVGVSRRFEDDKAQVEDDRPARAFNELSLLLLGDQLYLTAFYCYADEVEALLPEYEELKATLTMDNRPLFPAASLANEPQ
jgi:hypothetical protein